MQSLARATIVSRAAFDRQAACIEADVIVERLAPFAAGEVLIVRLAAFILIAQTLVDAFVALAVFGQNSLLAAFFIRPDESSSVRRVHCAAGSRRSGRR